MISTTIYFLVDTRSGRPFYCGKTSYPLPTQEIPQCLQYINPSSVLAKRIKKCGKYIQVHPMAIIPPTEDANAKYRAYLTWVMTNFPDCANQKVGRKVGWRGIPNIRVTPRFISKRLASKRRKQLVAKRNARL